MYLKPDYHLGPADAKKKASAKTAVKSAARAPVVSSAPTQQIKVEKVGDSDDSDLPETYDLEDVVMTDSDAESPLVQSQVCHLCQRGRLCLNIHKPTSYFL